MNALDAIERLAKSVGGQRFVDERECAARQAVLPLFLDGEDLHRDVTRRGVALEMVEHRPAEHIGQEYIERDRRRTELARELERVGAVICDEPLKPLSRARSSSMRA